MFQFNRYIKNIGSLLPKADVITKKTPIYKKIFHITLNYAKIKIKVDKKGKIRPLGVELFFCKTVLRNRGNWVKTNPNFLQNGGDAMMVDPTNVAAQYTNNRPLDATSNIGRENPSNEGRPEAGQTSETGPAVMSNISAASLETTRAVNAPEQTADQNRTNTVVEGEEKGQNKQELRGKEVYQQSRLVDVVA